MSITLKNHEEPGSSNARLEDTSETSEPLGPLLILPEDEPPNFKMSRVYIVEPMAMDTYLPIEKIYNIINMYIYNYIYIIICLDLKKCY